MAVYARRITDRRIVDGLAFAGFALLGVFLFFAVIRIESLQGVLGLYIASGLLLGSGFIGYKLPGWIAAAYRPDESDRPFGGNHG